MSSGYFDPRPERQHRCNLPRPYPTHKGWRCSCGKAYLIETLPDRDTNPGESHYQWRRAPEHDERPDPTRIGL